MATLHEFSIAKSHSRSVVDGQPTPWVEDNFAHLVLDRAGMDAVSRRLAAFGTDADSFLFLDSLTRSRGGVPDPVAIIIYPRDYFVAGHFLQLRGDRADVKFTFASYRPQAATPVYPPLSVVYLPDWEVGQRLAGSPLVADAWADLMRADHSRRWICLADSPPADWLAATEATDRVLFGKLTGSRLDD